MRTPPAAIPITFPSFCTGTGADRPIARAPSPICPSDPLPQHHTVPSTRTTQVCDTPAAIVGITGAAASTGGSPSTSGAVATSTGADASPPSAGLAAPSTGASACSRPGAAGSTAGARPPDCPPQATIASTSPPSLRLTPR